jgi:hypothetical protein
MKQLKPKALEPRDGGEMARRRKYTEDEIALCMYAALHDRDQIGGIDSIRALEKRSRASIKMKIQNIVAMCDEEGFARSAKESALTGLPQGEKGRRTNWKELVRYSKMPRQDHLQLCKLIIDGMHSLPGEIVDGRPYREGSKRSVVVNSYERDPRARQACLDHYGTSCVVCGFDFERAYGETASGFIHVHHLRSLADIGEEYVVDPVSDLRPVCPNCHAVIHLGNKTRPLQEVIDMLGTSDEGR